MPIIPFFLRRPAALLKIPEAIARGLTPTAFIKELDILGLTYRRTIMLADWRSVAGIKVKEGLLRYVRKDRLPAMKAIADVEWNFSQDYMYLANTWSRIRPDEPLIKRQVNLMSDIPLTPSQIEEQIYRVWGAWENYVPERLERVQVYSAYHKIPVIGE